MKRRYTRLVATVGAVALFLAFGGLDFTRWAIARWRASLQPPTVEQIQRAVPDTVPLRASLPPIRGKMWLSDPPRPLTVSVVLASILASTVLAMYVTGRPTKS
jgi:hypothetical protein